MNAIPDISEIHKYLKKNEEINLEIAGHTDTVGSEQYNMQLSEKRVRETAEYLLEKGIYVIGFSYPVVPKGQARIRTQMSAGHSLEHVDKAIDAFIEVGREMGVIS